MSKRQSIAPTYDSRQTGPRYHVTTRVNDRTISFEKPIDDPFVRQTVHIGTRDLIRSLFRRRLEVVVLVGADQDLVDDVMELDSNTLLPYCTRRDEFNAGLFAEVSFQEEVAELIDEHEGTGDE